MTEAIESVGGQGVNLVSPAAPAALALGAHAEENRCVLVLACVLSAIAAVIHIWIFVLESIRWTAPSTRRIFGVRSAEDAATMRLLAFNQGFYNLFLALIAGLGVLLAATGATVVGITLMFAGVGTMLAAALVLLLADRRMARAALVQGTVPLLTVVALLLTVTSA